MLRVVAFKVEKASETVLRVVTFAVMAFIVVTFIRVAKMLVVESAFETQRFPWMLMAFPKGDVPIPMFEVAISVVTFCVPITFAKFRAVILDVETELDT